MSNIGSWFRRAYRRSQYETTKWHFIESEIDTRLITRCGRQMERDTGNAGGQQLEFLPYVEDQVDTGEICEVCYRRSHT
jgi:hypothetical protein